MSRARRSSVGLANDASVDRTISLGVLLAVAIALPAVADAQTPTFRPPDFEKKIAALRKAGPDLVPLFVLGDVNEDGVVDARDAELVRRLVQSGGEPQPSGEISCPAAADLDRNGVIDKRDLDLLSSWVKASKVAVPALSFQSYLPCNFKQFFVAASKIVLPGGTARIRFLMPQVTTANSTVKLDEGKADVRRAQDGRGYIVTVDAAANSGDLINLRIELPGARAYFYTIEVGRLAR